MAGDWIKMRTWLAKDPKVIAIADYLSLERSFMDWMSDPARRTCDTSVYEHVTRHVTVCVTVTGLLQVWGVTREDGHREGDDLIVPMTSPEAMDEIAGFPGIGGALEFVGWAVYDKENHRTVFPKFFSRNIPNDEMRKQKDAERKRRQREKKADASADSHADASADSHADVTHREEKRREEKSIKKPPIVPQGTNEREPRRFVKPTVEEVRAYCLERKNTIDPQTFVDHYEAKGWLVGKTPMRNWKACVHTWEGRRREEAKSEPKDLEPNWSNG